MKKLDIIVEGNRLILHFLYAFNVHFVFDNNLIDE